MVLHICFYSDVMKEVIILIFLFLFLGFLTNALEIDITVEELLQGNVSSLIYNPTSNDVFKISIEFYNTGSIRYTARTRVDFMCPELKYTGWSDEKTLLPGERKSFDIYWYNFNSTKNFTGKLRIYYENEILEYGSINFQIKNSTLPEDVFEISDFRTYDNHVKFSLKSSKSLDDIILIPSSYPQGWIVEQKEIEKIEKGDKISVNLPYGATVWEPDTMSISALTQDGKYYSSRTFTLKKEAGLTKYVNYLLDGLRVLLNI